MQMQVGGEGCLKIILTGPGQYQFWAHCRPAGPSFKGRAARKRGPKKNSVLWSTNGRSALPLKRQEDEKASLKTILVCQHPYVLIKKSVSHQTLEAIAQ